MVETLHNFSDFLTLEFTGDKMQSLASLSQTASFSYLWLFLWGKKKKKTLYKTKLRICFCSRSDRNVTPKSPTQTFPIHYFPGVIIRYKMYFGGLKWARITKGTHLNAEGAAGNVSPRHRCILQKTPLVTFKGSHSPPHLTTTQAKRGVWSHQQSQELLCHRDWCSRREEKLAENQCCVTGKDLQVGGERERTRGG